MEDHSMDNLDMSIWLERRDKEGKGSKWSEWIPYRVHVADPDADMLLYNEDLDGLIVYKSNYGSKFEVRICGDGS